MRFTAVLLSIDMLTGIPFLFLPPLPARILTLINTAGEQSPSVRPAQLELSLPLPPTLTLPCPSLRSHFGLNSNSGNIISNIVLNFSLSGIYQFRIDTGLSSTVQTSKEEFSRVLREIEGGAIPIYLAIIHTILSYSRGDLEGYLKQTGEITEELRPVLGKYYNRVHNKTITHSA